MLKKSKYFNSSIVGLFFIVLIASSYFFVQHQLNIAIQNSTEAGNAVLTRVFVNETWSEISPLLPEPGADLEAIKSNPNIKTIDSKIRRFISYTDVMKVKLYNVKGITVYSSEVAQIGEDKSKNLGFQQAVRGSLASELIYRGHFGAFDGEIYNRNLVSTYAPIRDGYQVVAVAEIYSDRTLSIKTTSELLNKFLIFLASICVFLYLIIIYIFEKHKFKNPENSQEVTLNENVSQTFAPMASLQTINFGPNKLSAEYLKGIVRLVHIINLSIGFNKNNKLESNYVLSSISDVSAGITSRLTLNDLMLSLENESYSLIPQIVDLEVLIKNLKEYVVESTNLNSNKVHFYLSEDVKHDLYLDASLINNLFLVIFNFLSEKKFEGDLQVKFLRINNFVEVMTVIEFGHSASEYLHYLTDFFKRASSYLNKTPSMHVDVRLSGHSAFIDFKLQSLQNPLTVAPQFNKIGLLFDKKIDDTLVKLMLDDAGIQYIDVNSNVRLEQSIKNDEVDMLVIDADYLIRKLELFNQLSDLIDQGLLSKNQVLLVQPSYCEFENSLNLPNIILPFSPADFYNKLNISQRD